MVYLLEMVLILSDIFLMV